VSSGHHMTWKEVAAVILVMLLAAAALFALICICSVRATGEVQGIFGLVVGGVVVLLVVVAVVATAFSLLGLSDKGQALALPEGSIRSVIALALLVLFSILTVFLYGRLENTASGKLDHLTHAEALAFADSHPNLVNLKIEADVSRPADPPRPDPPPARAGGGSRRGLNGGRGTSASPPAAPSGGVPATTPTELYTVTYGGSTDAADYAKQILTLLGTLVTSVVSFYFGAKTATSAASASADQTAKVMAPPKPAMSLSGLDPASYAVGERVLTLLGNNLGSVVHARIERNGKSMQLSGVQSNPTRVSGHLTIVNEMVDGGPWNVIVDDGDGTEAHLDGKLTFTR
jgi:hypothetical protein